MAQAHIAEWMARSGVSFGTSGARGLAVAMTDEVCYLYSRAFLAHLQAAYQLPATSTVVIGGDFRPSTPRIMAAVAMAVRHAGNRVINAGLIPTPALAFFAMQRGLPCIMVTGSHIPDDRNGIKFYRTDGEILKDDEEAVRASCVDYDASLFDTHGMLQQRPPLPAVDAAVEATYVQRYIDFFPADCLQGKRIGVYQHSTVARDILVHVLKALAAEVVPLGRSDHFIPVDTEAIREEDVQLARQWSAEYGLDAVVSADGDGDRPLLSDEHGQWLRGDVAGILCARYLQAQSVVTPVSSNSALEACGEFPHIRRTRIGSPYVIAAMQQACAAGEQPVVGYEANGGFLTASDIIRNGLRLTALPTRDAMLVPLAILALANEQPVSALLQSLPPRFTSSGRLQNIPTDISRQHLADIIAGGLAAASAWAQPEFAAVRSMDTTDGLRMTLENDEIIHLRPSGNAPELRCYNEAASQQRADAMNALCLKKLRMMYGSEY